MPEVDTFSRRLGTGLGGGLGESYHGDLFIRLKPDHARPTLKVMAAVSAAVGELVPGVEIETAQLMEDLIRDLTAVPQPIEIKLTGATPSALNTVAEMIATAIKGIDGVNGIKSGVNLAGDALEGGGRRPWLRQSCAHRSRRGKRRNSSHPHAATREIQRSAERGLYRKRNLVERYFCRLKHFRRIATRYDKLASNFLAAVALASARL